ncbi:Short-chain dehydrogenase/reductase bet4 [Cladobotryum mycophilum]|uniref:Short-chain dehydrogenase/reductase bet4 n=1 Tax=Cladobotryum mycophilum TaxID=491253 RepID=A0ABR0SCC5_9HYPO
MASDNSKSAVRPPKPSAQGFASMWTQMYPPKPAFTEKDVPDLSSKVYIVTGASSGVGKETAQVLYSRNAKVYIATRSEKKANEAILSIKAAWPKSGGELVFLHLNLADLSTVKKAANEFLAKETKLHVLFNNAVIQALNDTDGSQKTAQGHEIHLGVNIFGPFLFTRILTPTLVVTAKIEPPNTMRVVWVSSMGLEAMGEKSKGISTDYLEYWPAMSPLERYGISKAGNWLYAIEMARQLKEAGVLSMPVNPGHLASDLYRDGGSIFKTMLNTFVLYPSINGAYVELFAGFSSDITIDKSGEWIVPWGRFYSLRPDLLEATRSEAEGGNGHAQEFWAWSEEQVHDFIES